MDAVDLDEKHFPHIPHFIGDVSSSSSRWAKMLQTSDLFLYRLFFCLSGNSVGRGLSIVAASPRKGKTFLKVTLLEINSRSQIGNPTGDTLVRDGLKNSKSYLFPTFLGLFKISQFCFLSFFPELFLPLLFAFPVVPHLPLLPLF